MAYGCNICRCVSRSLYSTCCCGARSRCDTVWANTAAAYESLQKELKDLAEQLWALHTNEFNYARKRENVSPEDEAKYRDVFTSILYETEHPVVHVHSEISEKNLLLGHLVKTN